MVTRPITFDGRYLELNYATSAAGSIRVEVQDQAGRPIPGYTLEECPYIIGNEIARLVGWDPRAVRDPLPETGAPVEAMREDGAVAFEEGPGTSGGARRPGAVGRDTGTPSLRIERRGPLFGPLRPWHRVAPSPSTMLP